MLRPRMKAPKFAIPCAANSLSTSIDPPSCPCIARNAFVWKYHWKISGPRLPSGSFRLCSVPALKPSNETANPATRTFCIIFVLPGSKLHAIADQGRSLRGQKSGSGKLARISNEKRARLREPLHRKYVTVHAVACRKRYSVACQKLMVVAHQQAGYKRACFQRRSYARAIGVLAHR